MKEYATITYVMNPSLSDLCVVLYMPNLQSVPTRLHEITKGFEYIQMISLMWFFLNYGEI